MGAKSPLARQKALRLCSAYVELLHTGRKDTGVFISAKDRRGFFEGVFESLG